MGTRHITAVIYEGEYVVAQYGQWDGYPSGAGADICAFLRQADLGRFKDRLKSVRFLSSEEIEDLWVEAGAERGSDSVNMAVSERFEKLYPTLHRNSGSSVLRLIYEGAGFIPLRNDLYFVADGLFCEWAYVIDMDSCTLEIYEGFNSKPLQDGDRFKFLEGLSRVGYQPPKLVNSISFEALPDKDLFLKAIEQYESATRNGG